MKTVCDCPTMHQIYYLYLSVHKQKVDTVVQIVEKHDFQKNSHFMKLAVQIGHSHLLEFGFPLFCNL